jgi:hypothetical protein
VFGDSLCAQVNAASGQGFSNTPAGDPYFFSRDGKYIYTETNTARLRLKECNLIHEAAIMKLIICTTIIALLALTASGAVDSKNPVLTLTIHCDQTNLKAGDEIPITFVIKNEGDKPYPYLDRNYDSEGRLDEYKLIATGQDGKAIADPRAKWSGGIGGGECLQANLAPGKSFTKTIDLNRWALVSKGGTYKVTGNYYAAGKEIVSEPVEIIIQPRSDLEMGNYINDLAAQLRALQESKKGSREKQEKIIQKLIFTCDNRIVPALIDALYADDKGGNEAFWVAEGMDYYLPKDDRNTAALVKAATERGMADDMSTILQESGCPPQEIKKLIPISLSSDHPKAWAEGALAAQQYGDDSFMPRLIAIAMDKDNDARYQAFYALALNRTDESVEALKQLLLDQQVQPFVAEAIRTAYLYRGNSQGRKLLPDDFPAEYQRAK